jgi:hypothetical protein
VTEVTGSLIGDQRTFRCIGKAYRNRVPCLPVRRVCRGDLGRLDDALAAGIDISPRRGRGTEKMMKVTGGCHCRQITYEAEVDPTTVRVCHCTDCQRLSGTAFRTNISSLPGTFVLKSGTPKIYIKTAESGNKRAHAFCSERGAPIYAAAPEPNPSTVGLRVGGIDQRAQCEPPIRQGWCRSALPWSMDLRGVARADQQ